jgi:hypothetical protein
LAKGAAFGELRTQSLDLPPGLGILRQRHLGQEGVRIFAGFESREGLRQARGLADELEVGFGEQLEASLQVPQPVLVTGGAQVEQAALRRASALTVPAQALAALGPVLGVGVEGCLNSHGNAGSGFGIDLPKVSL